MNKPSPIDKFCAFILSPATKFLPFLITIWVLSALPSFYLWGFRGQIKQALSVVAITLACSWVLSLPLNVKNIRFVKIWKYTVLIISCIYCLLDAGSISFINEIFSIDMASILIQTNPAEAREFIATFLSMELLLLILSFFGTAFGLGYLCRKIQTHIPKLIAFLILLCALCGALWTIRAPFIVNKTIIGRTVLLSKFRLEPDLTKIPTYPTVEANSPLPDKVIIIIGESHSSDHSQLYGYNKPNQPNLTKLYDNGELLVAPDVKSAGVETITCMKLMFTMAHSLHPDSVDWTKQHRQTEILHNAGYTTRWISNQGNKGAFDNIGQRISATCDTSDFSGKFNTSLAAAQYDDVIIKMLEEFQPEPRKTVNFIHLLGSHESFKSRYPESYNHFKPSDYPDKTPIQAIYLSEYDNSILFNDYVVSEIISRFKNQDSIIIYLSDHGLDLFVTNPTWARHASKSDPVSVATASKVPFYIYISPSAKEKHPDLVTRAEEIVSHHVDLTYLPEIVMNILDIRLLN